MTDIRISPILSIVLMPYVPRFHICAYNPTNDGQAAIDDLVRPTADEAEAVFWARVEMECVEADVEFDRDDWVLKHRMMLGGN